MTPKKPSSTKINTLLRLNLIGAFVCNFKLAIYMKIHLRRRTKLAKLEQKLIVKVWLDTFFGERLCLRWLNSIIKASYNVCLNNINPPNYRTLTVCSYFMKSIN